MTVPRRPAAYLPPAAAAPLRLASEQVMAEAARRGWPVPVVYADDPGPTGEPGPALGRLEAAITAGRHDALLIPAPGSLGDPAAPLMRVLARCARHGVAVGGAPPRAAAGPDTPSRPAGTTVPLAPGTGSLLARISQETLAELYPDWQTWLDRHGWHARRRAAGFIQEYRPGAPVFSVHASTAAALAAQLCRQQPARTSAPDGGRARPVPPPQPGRPADTHPRSA